MGHTIRMLALLLLVSCGTTAEPGCVAGMSIACACNDGRMGAQTCQADHTYMPCVCSASMDAGASTDAGAVDSGPPGPDAHFPDGAVPTSRFRQLALGEDTTCVLLWAGTIYCWGANDRYQLGDGTTDRSLRPVMVGGITDAVAIAVGTDHGLALLSDGTVQCWGDSLATQCGFVDTDLGFERSPIPVPDVSGAVALDGNDNYACTVQSNGSGVCWGTNPGGASQTPTAIAALSNVLQLSVSNQHFVCGRRASDVYCWGTCGDGQCGVGPVLPSAPTLPVTGLTDAVDIDLGYRHTCAVRSTGGVSCWGEGDNGALGDGTTDDRYSPVPVAGLTDAITVATGATYSCALRASGSVSCWGNNDNGNFGNGTTESSLVPVEIPELEAVTSLATGSFHTCAIRADGVYCWGQNAHGQLGIGSMAGANSPQLVTGI